MNYRTTLEQLSKMQQHLEEMQILEISKEALDITAITVNNALGRDYTNDLEKNSDTYAKRIIALKEKYLTIRDKFCGII